MKKVAILATALAAALCVAPLAACDEDAKSFGSVEVNGKAFNMADYAIELPESRTVKGGSSYMEVPEFKSVQELNVQLSTISWNGNYSLDVAKERGTGENAGKYRLYDLKGSKSMGDWYSSIDAVSYNTPFLALTNSGSSDMTYSYAYPTGELVTTKTFDSLYEISANSNSFYYDGKSTDYYSLTYPTDADTETTVYVAYIDGAWKKLTEAEVHPQQETGGYEVGDVLGMAKRPLADLETYPDYIYKDYSYTKEGSGSVIRYTFYKNDEKLNSFTAFGTNGFFTLGKYCYYYEMQPVSSEATSGYNVEMTSYSSSAAMKFNVVLHRYNFVESKDEVVDTDYFFTFSGSSMGPLYNRNAKDFDRIATTAVPKIGGVAIVSEQSPYYSLILDDEAKVSLDLSGKNVASTFYRLSDNRYLSGSVILDKEMNTVADLSTFDSTIVWEEQSLILCKENSDLIAVDYDGKVAIAGMRTMSSSSSYAAICGSSVIAMNEDGGTAVFSKTATNGKTLDEIMGDVDYDFGPAMLYTNADGTYTFYTMAGKQIGTFEGTNISSSSSAIMYGETCYVSATDADGNAVTLLFK